MNRIKKVVVGMLIMACMSPLGAQVSLPRLFSDNMVIQREKPVHIWGKAAPGERVTVSFFNTEMKVRAAKNGEWEAFLPALPAGGPYELLVKGKKNEIKLANILVGDVWLCSGQSNMEFGLNSEMHAQEAIASSANPMLRLYTVPKNVQTREQEDLAEGGQWSVCGPETAPSFSAVAYYFGQKIQKETGVPVGLINSSWGGTDIETWTSWEGSIACNPNYAVYKGKDLETALGYSMDDVARFNEVMKVDEGLKLNYADPATDVSGWESMYAPQAWDGVYKKEDGVIWFRKDIVIDSEIDGEEGTLRLGPIDDEDITWVNGVKVGEIAFWMADRTYTVPAGVLKKGKNTIVVRIKDNSSVGGMYGQADQLSLEVGGKKYALAGDWLIKPTVLSSKYGFSFHGTGPNSFSSLLYNGMIKAITPFPIKGAIWYQGENNAGRAFTYRSLFKGMITDWRTQWGYDFPFLWVQLASFMQRQDEPGDSDWAELREAQDMALALPNTAQAVITDIGEAFDIHPRNKKDVGLRLAHSALGMTYGKDLLIGGPIYKSMEIEGSRIILSFDQVGKGLSLADHNRYGYVYGFSIAGSDQKFVWAQAYLEGDKVIVFSDKVASPVAVRYGWENNPIDINLVNSEGLLASPFRTDNWKGITE